MLGIERQPLGRKGLEILGRLDRELDELRHAGVVALLELAHQDALVVDVDLGALVLLDHLVREVRHRSVPGVNPLQLVQAKAFGQTLTVPAQLRPLVALRDTIRRRSQAR